MTVPRSSARSSQNAVPHEDGWRKDRAKRRNVSMQAVSVIRPNNALNGFTRPPPQSGFRSVSFKTSPIRPSGFFHSHNIDQF